MAGEEIHTGIVACIIIVVVGVKSPVQVPGAGNAPGCLPGMPVVPFEIPPEGIPVTAVPLRPALAGRKLPHLVQPPCIPGLRNQLYIAQYGIGGQKLQKGRAVQRGTVLMPPQNAGQVEAEAVDAVAHRPVPQAFQDQLPHNGIIAVQSVAAPAEIVIMPLGSQHIVHFVVKALEAECGASLVALRRMIEHHIQNNLNTVVVERLDQQLQLRALGIVLVVCNIAGIGGEKSHRIVSPVVQEPSVPRIPGVHGLVKLKYGHQLHRVDAKLLQIRNFLHKPCESSPVLYSGGWMKGKSPHMKLIDHQVAHGPGGLGHISPVKNISDYAGMVGTCLFPAPDPLPRHRAGVRVQQNGVFVKGQPVLRLKGAVHLVGILELLNV